MIGTWKAFCMQVVINLSVSDNIFYISNPQLLSGVFGLKLGGVFRIPKWSMTFLFLVSTNIIYALAKKINYFLDLILTFLLSCDIINLGDLYFKVYI